MLLFICRWYSIFFYIQILCWRVFTLSFTWVLGSISGSAGILAKISQSTIPKENTSTWNKQDDKHFFFPFQLSKFIGFYVLLDQMNRDITLLSLFATNDTREPLPCGRMVLLEASQGPSRMLNPLVRVSWRGLSLAAPPPLLPGQNLSPRLHDPSV